MKKIGLIIFITALIFGIIITNVFSFGKTTGNLFNFSINKGVSGSGNVAAEKREVADFQGIDVSGIIQVEVVSQKDFDVEIEADDNLLPLIKTEVSNGVLRLSTENSISSKNPIRVRIFAPNIENIEASGVSVIFLADLSNENLQIDASGASKITAAGETANLIIRASGAGKIDANNLKAEDASIDVSGASAVSVYAARELKTDASGASSIIYSGKPERLVKKTSGASSIRER